MSVAREVGMGITTYGVKVEIGLSNNPTTLPPLPMRSTAPQGDLTLALILFLALEPDTSTLP